MPDISAPEVVKATGDGTRQGVFDRLHVGELVFLLAVLLAWSGLLAIGMFLASQPYRDTLVRGQLGFGDYAFAWVMAFVSYTFTNVALLSGLASLAGAGARHVEAQLAGGERIGNLRALYASAALRGFFVYLIALSGLMILVENLFTNIAKSPDIYLRLAGSISLVSFMLGFNPEMFARFLDRIARLLEDQGARTRG